MTKFTVTFEDGEGREKSITVLAANADEAMGMAIAMEKEARGQTS